MSDLTLVTLDNAHQLIPQYIVSKGLMIGSYEDMMDVILSMIKDRYFFNMDKNILRGCLEDLTYMYSPGDDVNKDRVVSMLEPSDDEDDDEDDDSDSNGDDINMEQFQEMMMKQISSQMGGMDMAKMMESFGGLNVGDNKNEEVSTEENTNEEVSAEDNSEEINTEESVKLAEESGGAE